MQLSYDQIKALQKQTAYELHVSDPAPILQALNLDFSLLAMIAINSKSALKIMPQRISPFAKGYGSLKILAPIKTVLLKT